MPNYRRLRVPGGRYFFTVAIADRSSDLLTRNIDLFRAAYAEEQATRPFKTEAIVILPDHFHCLWRLPPEDDDFSTRLRRIKERFTRSLPNARPSGRRIGEACVWQRRFWEHAIRNDGDFNRHVDYIHFNPVKHGHVSNADEWPYSTWRRWKSRAVHLRFARCTLRFAPR